MTQTRGIVYFSILDWWYHARSHADFQLALELSRDHKVLFINSIGMRFPTPRTSRRPIRRIIRKAASTSRLLRHPVKDLPNFAVYSPLMVPAYSHPRLRHLSAAAIRGQVTALLRWTRMTNPLFIITVPTAWEVVKPLAPNDVIYNRSDRHSAFPEGDHDYLRQIETDLMLEANLVLYVNGPLMEQERRLTGDRSYLLGHGVDLEVFRPGDVPEEVQRIPRPRIGFFGDLRERIVDFALLTRLASELPDHHLVLIGDASDTLRRLPQSPNVHFLGRRSHVEVAALARGFDVGIVPYTRTEWLLASNPIKIKEYLALGLPIVSTDFPAVHDYGPLIEIAVSDSDFVMKVRQSAASSRADNPPERAVRRRSVEQHSWRAKADELIEVVSTQLGAPQFP